MGCTRSYGGAGWTGAGCESDFFVVAESVLEERFGALWTHLSGEDERHESEDDGAGGGEHEGVPDENAHSEVCDVLFRTEENIDWLGLAVVALIGFCFCNHVANFIVGEEFLGAGSAVAWVGLWKGV